MDAAGIAYLQRDNCFTWLEVPEQAQRLSHEQVRAAWPELLNAMARELNPLHARASTAAVVLVRSYYLTVRNRP
jgi:hypothetical protein